MLQATLETLKQLPQLPVVLHATAGLRRCGLARLQVRPGCWNGQRTAAGMLHLHPQHTVSSAGPPHDPQLHAVEGMAATLNSHPLRRNPANMISLAVAWRTANIMCAISPMDEDRCRVYVRDLPRNLACLTNTAISIIRCQTEFPYVPEANRHFSKRDQEALDLLLKPPSP